MSDKKEDIEKKEGKERYDAIKDRHGTKVKDKKEGKDSDSNKYEDWSINKLRDKADELDIQNNENMERDELIKALQNY